MQLNLPPRLLRVIVGCLVIGTILIVTVASMIPSRRIWPQRLSFPEQYNITWNLVLQQEPTWTTEQLKPRFAYSQYATDMNYLCNTV